MFRTLKADKDSYITNRFINSKRVVNGNVGIAGSLDLFKLYGITTIASGANGGPQRELTRCFLHFDLDPLRQLVQEGKVDTSHPSFKCHLNLKDVYGGQTTPSKFTIDVFPLSASFDEGLGKDSVYYSDQDKCNWLSSSMANPWFMTGCGLACFATGSGDYISSSLSLPSTKVSQYFSVGTEDLLLDVTSIVSATLSGELPDRGLRLSFSEALEQDNFTYFVKRFGSRQTYDEAKHPRVLVRFDDSIADDSNNLFLDTTSRLFLYNYVSEAPVNLMSASAQVTGSNSLLLELKTSVSGVGNYSLYFTGSQLYFGSNPVSGVYYADVNLPLSNQNIKSYFDVSGSVNFVPVWKSLDGSLAFVTGSQLKARGPERTSARLAPRKYAVNVWGYASDYSDSQDVTMRVHLFDNNNPIIKAQRLPVELPGVVVRNSYYAVRDKSTNDYAIPFDSVWNSTKLSSDSKGMYFSFNTSALVPNREYVVDIMLVLDNSQHKYLDASPTFRVRKS